MFICIDDLNIIDNILDINEACINDRMKGLGQTKFYLGLQLKHFRTGIFVHQIAYIQKSYPSKIPMAAISINMKKYLFRSWDEEEELLGHEVPYLSII